MRRYFVVLGIVLFATACISGCGDEGTQISITTPRVTATIPADGATGVGLNTSISVTFSDEMEASSLDSIYVNGRAVFRVVYDNGQKTATAYLDSLLDRQTVCQVKVSSYCMDKTGNNLNGDHIFTFTTGEFGCDELEDTFDTNKSIATAAEIEYNTKYTLLPSCGGEDDMHFFKIVLAEPTMVIARYKIVYALEDTFTWRFYFKRFDGEDYAASEASIKWQAAPAEEFHHSFLPGIYYMKTGKRVDSGYAAVYEIEFETSEACTDDAYEDNDFFDEATPVTAGTLEDLRGCYIDDDYYSIELTTGQRLTVTLDAPDAAGTYRRFWMYAPTKTYMVRDGGYGSPATLEGTASMDGTHYVDVWWWTDDMDYELTFEVSGP